MDWEAECNTCGMCSLYGTSVYVHPLNRCPTSAAIVLPRSGCHQLIQPQKNNNLVSRSPEPPLQYVCSIEFTNT